jgi:threonine dehydrogenase-like Zn-dependent dehydrogenase
MTNHNLPKETTNVYFEAAQLVALRPEPTRDVRDGEYFVKTLYSGISAGTELTFFLGTNPKSSEGWDQERRLFRRDMEPDLEDIFPKLEGYMEVGEVTVSKNADHPVGQKVAMLYHHKSGHIATPDDFCIPLPDDFDPLLGIWVAKMGPISMNGILYAADEVMRAPVKTLKGSLQGQRVIVFGAGMIGLLCGIFAKWAGASEVAIVDGIEERLEVAKKLGLTPFKADPALAVDIKDHWKADDPMDTGADIALQCTGSDYLLDLAYECLREQGTVVDLGFYQQGAPLLHMGKEFHHNRLRHVCAQIGALPRWQQKEWDKPRLSHETIAFLQDHGAQLKETLITHIVPFSKTQEVMDALANRDPAYLQVVLHPDEQA